MNLKLVLFGCFLACSVNAVPLSRQVGLSDDVQVLSINGTDVCQVAGRYYHRDDDLPTNDPCEYCTCQPPGFACQVVKCEHKPECRSLQRSGLCCPEYICDCEYNGNIYMNGDKINDPTNPCEDCYCITGDVVCSVIQCRDAPENCSPIAMEGRCCPSYDCSVEQQTEKNQDAELKVTSLPEIQSVVDDNEMTTIAPVADHHVQDDESEEPVTVASIEEVTKVEDVFATESIIPKKERPSSIDVNVIVNPIALEEVQSDDLLETSTDIALNEDITTEVNVADESYWLSLLSEDQDKSSSKHSEIVKKIPKTEAKPEELDSEKNMATTVSPIDNEQNTKSSEIQLEDSVTIPTIEENEIVHKISKTQLQHNLHHEEHFDTTVIPDQRQENTEAAEIQMEDAVTFSTIEENEIVLKMSNTQLQQNLHHEEHIDTTVIPDQRQENTEADEIQMEDAVTFSTIKENEIVSKISKTQLQYLTSEENLETTPSSGLREETTNLSDIDEDDAVTSSKIKENQIVSKISKTQLQENEENFDTTINSVLREEIAQTTEVPQKEAVTLSDANEVLEENKIVPKISRTQLPINENLKEDHIEQEDTSVVTSDPNLKDEYSTDVTDSAVKEEDITTETASTLQRIDSDYWLNMMKKGNESSKPIEEDKTSPEKTMDKVPVASEKEDENEIVLKKQRIESIPADVTIFPIIEDVTALNDQRMQAEEKSETTEEITALNDQRMQTEEESETTEETTTIQEKEYSEKTNEIEKKSDTGSPTKMEEKEKSPSLRKRLRVSHIPTAVEIRGLNEHPANQRISSQMAHLAKKYGLRPLTRRIHALDIQERRRLRNKKINRQESIRKNRKFSLVPKKHNQ